MPPLLKELLIAAAVAAARLLAHTLSQQKRTGRPPWPPTAP